MTVLLEGEREETGAFSPSTDPQLACTPLRTSRQLIQGPRAGSCKRQLDFIIALKISSSCACIVMDWNTAHVQENCISQKSIMTSSSSTTDSFSSLSSLFPTLTINLFCLISSSDISGFSFQHSSFSTRLKSSFLPVKIVIYCNQDLSIFFFIG